MEGEDIQPSLSPPIPSSPEPATDVPCNGGEKEEEDHDMSEIHLGVEYTGSRYELEGQVGSADQQVSLDKDGDLVLSRRSSEKN